MELYQIGIDAISSVGFPIVCCYFLFKANEKNEELHKKEIDGLRRSIDNNTKVIVRLLERLQDDGK